MILKFYKGSSLPFAKFEPYAVEEIPSKTPQQGQDDGELLNILKEIDEKILPNDLDRITQDAIQLLNSNSILDTQTTTSKYLTLLNQINKAKFNYELYDKAESAISAKNGLNEIAINDRGLLLGYNPENDDYDFFNLEEYINQNEYIALTNSELLSLRYSRPDLAFNSQILQMVKNGTSMKEVQDIILGIADELGNTSITRSSYQDIKASKGIQILQDAVSNGVISPDDISMEEIYKNTYFTSDQVSQIKNALNYIKKTLPENAKVLLSLKSNGQSLDDSILEALEIKHKRSVKFTSDNKQNNENKDKDINKPMAVLLDLGAETTLKFRGQKSFTLNIPGYEYDADMKGKELLSDFKSTEYSDILDFSQMTMGDQPVNEFLSENILINDKFIKAYLPIDQSLAGQGIIRPNLSYIDKLEEVYKDIKKFNVTDKDMINSIYQKHKLPKFFDEEGNPDIRYFKPFIVMEGSAHNDAFENDFRNLLDNPYFQQVPDEKARLLTTKLKGDKHGYDSYNKFWYEGSDVDMIVNGLVFIPVKPSIEIPMIGEYSYDEITDAAHKQRQEERAKQINIPGQL